MATTNLAPMKPIARFFFLLSCISLLSISSDKNHHGVVLAEKDSSYWPPGKTNPNVKNKMYWHEASNVIQDLDQFSKLYVVYHNCAWSPFGTPANDDENLAFQQYWYLGLTQTYRANVAFSLYGILKGSRDKECGSGTFINSFFTNYGAQHFLEAVQMNGYLGGPQNNERGRRRLNEEADENDEYDFEKFSSQCIAEMGDDDGGVDDGTIPEYGGNGFPNAVSYTLGCSEDQVFEYHSYEGATCDGHHYLQTEDSLESDNGQLDTLGCALLYDSDLKYTDDDGSGYEYTAEYDDQFWDNYANQGWGNYDEDGDDVPELSHPLDLLKYSHTCSIALFPQQCPDPYGKVAYYLDQINRGTRTVIKLDTDGSWRQRNAPWIAMLIAGSMMMITSLALDGKLDPRNWKLEPKAFGVDANSKPGRMISFMRSRFMECIGEEDDMQAKVEYVVDPSTAVQHSLHNYNDPALDGKIDFVSQRLETLKQEREQLKKEKIAKKNAPTEQKKESSFGGFGTMMGLESPQPLSQGVEAVRSPTFSKGPVSLEARNQSVEAVRSPTFSQVPVGLEDTRTDTMDEEELVAVKPESKIV